MSDGGREAELLAVLRDLAAVLLFEVDSLWVSRSRGGSWSSWTIMVVMRVVMHLSVSRSGARVTACGPSVAAFSMMFRAVVSGPGSRLLARPLPSGPWTGVRRAASAVLGGAW